MQKNLLFFLYNAFEMHSLSEAIAFCTALSRLTHNDPAAWRSGGFH
jgi:hypothetical protein